MSEISIEEIVFEFIDQCKVLFFPEQWNNTFLDYSKNEVLALLFIYRGGQVNMTEIAGYLGVPLNTATGIVSRLEKRGMIQRERDTIDKRVVTIAIRQEGKEFLAKQLQIIENYFHLLMDAITEEEKFLLMKLIGKILEIISQDLTKKDIVQDKKKKIRKITIE